MRHGDKHHHDKAPQTRKHTSQRHGSGSHHQIGQQTAQAHTAHQAGHAHRTGMQSIRFYAAPDDTPIQPGDACQAAPGQRQAGQRHEHMDMDAAHPQQPAAGLHQQRY